MRRKNEKILVMDFQDVENRAKINCYIDKDCRSEERNTLSVEQSFDVPFISELALREKQIQQNYRPIISVHKWFARRPGALFRGLLLAEFEDSPLSESYYRSHDFSGKRIADPFMGGGTPLLEANRIGCDVVGFDINPMAYWIVRQEMASLDLGVYREASRQFVEDLTKLAGKFYNTRCRHCGKPDASAKYFLWVKQQSCPYCALDFDLFPGYLLAENRRHSANVFVCSSCGKLTEVQDRTNPGACQHCGWYISLLGPARRNECKCPHCGNISKYPRPEQGPPKHRMFAIEYHCPTCKPSHTGRFFKEPEAADLTTYETAVTEFQKTGHEFIPKDEIPPGDETDRLHRWGYRHYDEMFNDRQLFGLSQSARLIASINDAPSRHALATNFSDLLRYQNMLCRYDTMALKSLDIFSVHGFPVGLIQCESNLIGIPASKGASVGSGGWSNIIEKFYKAKNYCCEPFEIKIENRKKNTIFCRGEWIGERLSVFNKNRKKEISLHCQDSASYDLPPKSLDAVLTDPPYFSNVQYAELMDFCYVWLRKLIGSEVPEFAKPTTRSTEELTGNLTMDRGIEHFAEGLSAVFQRFASALKPGAPLAFTFHHNQLDAYYPVAIAILDAGLVCTASLPCPAEMGASIHINGTGSSIVDSIFVCRSTGTMLRKWLAETTYEFAHIIEQDLDMLCQGGLKETQGDIRCVVFGHLIRLAVWHLRDRWNPANSIHEKFAVVGSEVKSLQSKFDMERWLNERTSPLLRRQAWRERENTTTFEGSSDAIPF